MKYLKFLSVFLILKYEASTAKDEHQLLFSNPINNHDCSMPLVLRLVLMPSDHLDARRPSAAAFHH